MQEADRVQREAKAQGFDIVVSPHDIEMARRAADPPTAFLNIAIVSADEVDAPHDVLRLTIQGFNGDRQQHDDSFARWR